MKKILYVVAEDYYFISHRLALAKAAQQAGYEVAVATHISKHQQDIESAGIKVYPLHLERRSLNPLSAFKTLNQLKKAMHSFKPDLMHLVALKPILFGNLAALTQKTAVVSAFTGMGYLYSSTKFHHRIIRNLFLLLYQFMFWINKAHIIVQNNDDAGLFKYKNIVPQDRLHLIKGSGVDIDQFAPRPREEGAPVTALLVARALKDKGIIEYIEAARILIKERNSKIHFVFAGLPDPHNPTSLTIEELQKYHDAGLIEWKGFQRDIPALWQNADIAVLPSYREGLPKTLLEAAAAGKPIIATDVPGCREICIDGHNGLLVQKYDVEGLADALEKLAKDKELREKMGQESRKLVEEELSLAAVNKSTLAVYQQLIKTA